METNYGKILENPKINPAKRSAPPKPSAKEELVDAAHEPGNRMAHLESPPRTNDEAVPSRPTVTFSKSDPAVAEHAELVERAQQAGKPKTLTRGEGKRAANRNRYLSQKEVRKKQGPPREGYNYDEYPYASSEQGGSGAHVEEVKAEPNQEAGRRLGRFLEGDNHLGRRIEPGEDYDVIIIP